MTERETDSMTLGSQCVCERHGQSEWRGTMLCDPEHGGCGLVLMIDCVDSMRRPSFDRGCGSYRCPACEKPLNEGRIHVGTDDLVTESGIMIGTHTRETVVPGCGRPICSSCFLDQVGRTAKPVSDAERQQAAAKKFRRKYR